MNVLILLFRHNLVLSSIFNSFIIDVLVLLFFRSVFCSIFNRSYFRMLLWQIYCCHRRTVCQLCISLFFFCFFNESLLIILFPFYKHNQCQHFYGDKHYENCNAYADFCRKVKRTYQSYHYSAPPSSCLFFLPDLLVVSTTIKAPASNITAVTDAKIIIATFKLP